MIVITIVNIVVTMIMYYIITYWIIYWDNIIWVNHNISPTWIKAMNGDDSPKINHDFQGSVVVRSL